MTLESTQHHDNQHIGAFAVSKKQHNEPLSDCVRKALQSHFSHMEGYSANGLYALVMEEVERPLFESVMIHTRGNQTKAAVLLGISRGTLRKKLALYQID